MCHAPVPPTAGEVGKCKIYVLDAAVEFGPLMGAPMCDVNSPFIWPFASPGRGIDGQEVLRQEDSQYAAGHWIKKVRTLGHAGRQTHTLFALGMRVGGRAWA